LRECGDDDNVNKMAEITTMIGGITFESTFKNAVLFKDAHCDVVAQKCLEAFASYGLKATQIAVRSGDLTFNYDLAFTLFNGNGNFKLSAEKLEISLQNAVSGRDLEIVQDCLAKIYEYLPLAEISTTVINANAQASFASPEAMHVYFLRFSDPARQIVSGGAIVCVRCDHWTEEVRLMAEKSLTRQTAVYLSWSTTWSGGKISREVLENLKTAFGESVVKIDLTFPK